ncbi:hypothetical protein BKA65DRAFT_515491 [Rhexocercosporidium sp. MPI-PUGE-AT-0058]|nr:hypothetical protein BKA65DRAFT_515491 [Rhexocercosporidium sp. MPI-PUGE-AT-0058]
MLYSGHLSSSAFLLPLSACHIIHKSLFALEPVCGLCTTGLYPRPVPPRLVEIEQGNCCQQTLRGALSYKCPSFVTSSLVSYQKP